jgi:hypothetical protein
LSTSAQPAQPAAARAATSRVAGVLSLGSRKAVASNWVARQGCPVSINDCASLRASLWAIALGELARGPTSPDAVDSCDELQLRSVINSGTNNGAGRLIEA